MAGPCMLSRRNPWRQPWPPSSPATPSRWSGSCGQGQGQPEHGRGGPGRDGSLRSKSYLSSFQLCVWPKSFWFFAFHEERWVDTEFYGGVPPVSQSGLKLTISWEMMMYFAEIFCQRREGVVHFLFSPIFRVGPFDYARGQYFVNWRVRLKLMFAPAPHLSLHEVNLSPKRPIFPRRRDLLHFLTHKCSKPSSFIPDIENRNKKVEDPERFSSDTSSTWIFVLFLSRVLLRYMYIIFGYTLYIFGHILHTSFAKCHPRSKTNFLWKAQKTKDDFQFGVSSSAR